jgi:hypothetical protein
MEKINVMGLHSSENYTHKFVTSRLLINLLFILALLYRSIEV